MHVGCAQIVHQALLGQTAECVCKALGAQEVSPMPVQPQSSHVDLTGSQIKEQQLQKRATVLLVSITQAGRRSLSSESGHILVNLLSFSRFEQHI